MAAVDGVSACLDLKAICVNMNKAVPMMELVVFTTELVRRCRGTAFVQPHTMAAYANLSQEMRIPNYRLHSSNVVVVWAWLHFVLLLV